MSQAPNGKKTLVYDYVIIGTGPAGAVTSDDKRKWATYKVAHFIWMLV